MLHLAERRLLQRLGAGWRAHGHAAVRHLHLASRRGLAPGVELDAHRRRRSHRAWTRKIRRDGRFVASPKTQLSTEDAAAILRHYRLSLRQLHAIPQGTINSNYQVITDAGPLFLRVCEGKSWADAAFESALIWHLGSRGLRTPALWRTRSGSAFVPFRRGQPVMLFSWVSGRQVADSAIDTAHAFHIGELLAELHLAAADIRREHAGIYTLRHIGERFCGAAYRRHRPG